MTLTYDTTLPRPYSRGGRVQGTRGIWTEDGASVYLEDISPGNSWEPFSRYTDDEKYEHPVWTAFRKEGISSGGHGGMDDLIIRDFTDCVREDKPFPIDAYDAAVIMAVTVLSEQSAAAGGCPKVFPDFTDGKWMKNKNN